MVRAIQQVHLRDTRNTTWVRSEHWPRWQNALRAKARNRLAVSSLSGCLLHLVASDVRRLACSADVRARQREGRRRGRQAAAERQPLLAGNTRATWKRGAHVGGRGHASRRRQRRLHARGVALAALAARERSDCRGVCRSRNSMAPQPASRACAHTTRGMLLCHGSVRQGRGRRSQCNTRQLRGPLDPIHEAAAGPSVSCSPRRTTCRNARDLGLEQWRVHAGRLRLWSGLGCGARRGAGSVGQMVWARRQPGARHGWKVGGLGVARRQALSAVYYKNGSRTMTEPVQVTCSAPTSAVHRHVG
jgi:hypothetical protein